MINASYHEPVDEISAETQDMHRTISSLMGESETAGSGQYDQDVDVCKDEDLKAILARNRDEGKEHAAPTVTVD